MEPVRFVLLFVLVVVLFDISEQKVCKSAFQAYRTKPYLGSRAEIKFDEVAVNLGGDYNHTTGKYKAPCEGIYRFTYRLRPSVNCGSTEDLITMLKHRSGSSVTRKVSHLSARQPQTATSSDVIYLQKGDKVWVRLHTSMATCTELDGWEGRHSNYNSFNGELIYELT